MLSIYLSQFSLFIRGISNFRAEGAVVLFDELEFSAFGN